MAEETVTAAAPVETPNWDDEPVAGISATATEAATTEADADKIVAAELADTATAVEATVAVDTTATPTVASLIAASIAPDAVASVSELAPATDTSTVLTAAKTRIKNPMDDFREALRQMASVIGEGGTSFLLAEFFGVASIDELEGADVFSALEKFNKLQP